MKQIITQDVLQQALTEYSKTNHNHNDATRDTHGFMSVEDKKKLDEINKVNFLGKDTGFTCSSLRNSDLNTCLSENHSFIIEAINGPETKCSGFLDVTQYTGGSDSQSEWVIRQKFTVANTGVEYSRCKYNGVWTVWQKASAPVKLVTGVKGMNNSSYKTGDVNISWSDVGAAYKDHTHPSYLPYASIPLYDNFEEEIGGWGFIAWWSYSCEYSDRNGTKRVTDSGAMSIIYDSYVSEHKILFGEFPFGIDIATRFGNQYIWPITPQPNCSDFSGDLCYISF